MTSEIFHLYFHQQMALSMPRNEHIERGSAQGVPRALVLPGSSRLSHRHQTLKAPWGPLSPVTLSVLIHTRGGLEQVSSARSLAVRQEEWVQVSSPAGGGADPPLSFFKQGDSRSAMAAPETRAHPVPPQQDRHGVIS